MPSRGLTRGAMTTVVIGATLATLVCSGGIAWLIVLALPPAQDALEQAIPAPVALSFNAKDRMAMRMLAPVYAQTLDIVVAHPLVIEHLGEPIETDSATDELYRLSDSALRSNENAIEYDLVGSKTRGIVQVTVQSSSEMQQGMRIGALYITEIKVTCEDGTVIQATPTPGLLGRP